MYGFTPTHKCISVDEALQKTTRALNPEGFGVLCDIDV